MPVGHRVHVVKTEFLDPRERKAAKVHQAEMEFMVKREHRVIPVQQELPVSLDLVDHPV